MMNPLCSVRPTPRASRSLAYAGPSTVASSMISVCRVAETGSSWGKSFVKYSASKCTPSRTPFYWDFLLGRALRVGNLLRINRFGQSIEFIDAGLIDLDESINLVYQRILTWHQ